MTKEEIKVFKEIVGEDNMDIFGDNAKLFSAKAKGQYIIWDDTLEVFYCIRMSSNNKTYDTKPFSLQMGMYDIIQYLSTTCDIDTLKTILAQLQSKGLNVDVEKICTGMTDCLYKVELK